TLHHKGGVKEADLSAIADSIKDEKEKEYPEATMWGNLPAKGFYVRHARNIKFADIEIRTEQPDVRPDFVREDVD
ncbi:MAG: glycoside hydrolase family 28 protein, partial [Prevotella sp.]|nr:glycoside hydrolase family 28 protein [Prevotella sp.]